MEFIDKCNQALFFPHYINFESLKWNLKQLKYVGYNFKKFSPTKQIIRDLLISEQKGKCCYCLKSLEKNNSTTIEHIYPQNPNITSHFGSYSINCIDRKAFNYSIQNIPNANLDNLPHDISYYNLLACCSNCNSQRGNNDIVPFIFDSTVKSKFFYDDDGNIFSSQYFNEIVSIGLADIYYKRNRKIWRQLKKELGSNSFLINKNILKEKIKAIASALYLADNDIYYLKIISDEDTVIDSMKYIYFFNN